MEQADNDSGKHYLLPACVAGLVYNGYFFWVGDLVFRAPSYFLHWPFAVIAFTFGLCLSSPNDGPSRQARRIFLIWTAIPCIVMMTLILYPVCLHRPGFGAETCASDAAEIRSIQQQTFILRVILPLFLAFCFSWLGAAKRSKENTSPLLRLPAIVRVFLLLAGPILILYGAGGVWDQELSIGSAGSIIHMQGLTACLIGGFFLILGCGLIDCGWRGTMTRWVIGMVRSRPFR